MPSWGRSELALSLLQDPAAPYTLEDVVQAVRESHDRDFIRRVLAKECPICLSVFPHSKVLDSERERERARERERVRERERESERERER